MVASFGVTIRELRRNKRMSQRELASHIGVDFTYISKIENNKLEPPSEEVIIKMSEVFGCNKHWLTLTAGKVPSDFSKVILQDSDIQRIIIAKLEGRI